jgi:hypothetical protein
VWLRAWAGKVKAQEGGGAAAAAEMRRASPKYVPREWMLVDAYTKAKSGDYSEVEALHELFKHPYDEQESIEAKYYKKVRHLSRTKPGAAASSVACSHLSSCAWSVSTDGNVWFMLLGVLVVIIAGDRLRPILRLWAVLDS